MAVSHRLTGKCTHLADLLWRVSIGCVAVLAKKCCLLGHNWSTQQIRGNRIECYTIYIQYMSERLCCKGHRRFSLWDNGLNMISAVWMTPLYLMNKCTMFHTKEHFATTGTFQIKRRNFNLGFQMLITSNLLPAVALRLWEAPLSHSGSI